MASQPSYVGNYRLVHSIGSGGFGVVYRAQHVETLEQVALKTVRVPRKELLWCIRHEIHGLARIDHPGVIRLIDHGIENGVPWYAMELVEGMTLDSYLQSIWPGTETDFRPESSMLDSQRIQSLTDLFSKVRTRSSENDGLGPAQDLGTAATAVIPAPGERPPAAGGELVSILTLIRHLCTTLAYIHGQGFVHLDLKPMNIFIRRDWTPLLFDFSLVSHANMVGRENIKVAGSIQGTLGYMAPERFRGELVDARSDLYSLGCLLYTCVTGQLPFQAESFSAFSGAHQSMSPVPPSLIVDGIPPELEDVILRLLSKRPGDRHGHANDVGHVLRSLGARNAAWGSDRRAPDYLYRPEFVGREQALEWFEKHLDSILEGQVDCVFVGAGSGLGKTRLMMEFAPRCELRNLRVTTGQCQPVSHQGHEQAPLLHPFRPLLQMIADHCLEKGRTETDLVVGPRGKALARCEPSLANLPGQDVYPESPPVTSDVARHRLLSALGETVAAFSRTEPLVVILDDLQWVDELSLEFLSLVQSGAFDLSGVLLVGTYRTDEVPPSLRLLLEKCGNEHQLELGLLDEDEVGQIVGGMLGLPDPGEPLVRFLARRSGGNPFFVAEYLRLAVSENILSRNDHGEWQLADRSEDLLQAVKRILPLPCSLRDLVTRRLTGLPRKLRGLLELASVLGQKFDAEVLEATCLYDRASLMETTAVLIGRQILEEAEDGHICFVHDTLRDVTYAGIRPALRRELHRIAAAAIETTYSDRPDFHNHHATLAHHWSAAGIEDKALEFLEKAGENSLNSGAYGQAYGFFSQALELEGEGRPPRGSRAGVHLRARWRRQLAECCLAQGKPAEGRKHLEEALALLGHPVPRRMWTLMLSLMYQIAQQTFRRLWPYVSLARSSRSRDTILEAASSYNRLLTVASQSHELTPMLYAALRNTNLAELAGSSCELARAYSSLQGILGVVPCHRRLAAAFRRRAHEAVESHDRGALLSVLLTDAACHLGQCEWDECLLALEKGQQAASEIGAIRQFEELEGIISTLHFLRGDFEKSTTHARAQYESALRGDQQGQCFGLLRICQIQLVLGRRDEALATLGTVETLIASGPGRAARIWHQALLATAGLMKGDAELARTAADRSQDLIGRSSPIFWYCIHAYSSVATVYLKLRESGRALSGADVKRLDKAAHRAGRNLERCARVLPACAPIATRLRGTYRWQRGQATRARQDWEKSAQLARRYQMPYEEALAHLEIGRRSPAESPENRTHLLRARHLLESVCPSAPALEEIRRALGGKTTRCSLKA